MECFGDCEPQVPYLQLIQTKEMYVFEGTLKKYFINKLWFSNQSQCSSHPRFRSITHTFGMVGHTHGPLDQRLSVISAAFQAATEIQEPQDWLVKKTGHVPMVFHQQVADLPSVLSLTQILTSCGTNIEMSANLKAIWSVKMVPLNSHVESLARTLSMSSCTRSPQLENGFCMLRSLRGAWTGKNTMSNMVCICLVSFPTPTGKLSKRFVTAGGSFEEKIPGIWKSIQAFYLLPTHYGPAAQKTQSWQASWYFFKVVKLQQGVALFDYQHGSKVCDLFLWWWLAPKFHVLFVRVLQLVCYAPFFDRVHLRTCPCTMMRVETHGWRKRSPMNLVLYFGFADRFHPQVGNVPPLFPDILCKVFLM